MKTRVNINAYKTDFETEFATSPSVISSVWNCLNGDNYKIKESFAISEWDIYGSKRLGVLNDTTKLFSLDYDGPVFYGIDSISKTSNKYTYFNNNTFKNYYFRYLGTKSYELSNHLGNVLATVSDRKIDSLYPSNITTLYASDIRSATDYFAFGWEKAGRTFSSSSYRYGMNTQEKDLELGSEYTNADFWEYNSKVIKRWNTDILGGADISPYAVFNGNPICFADPSGAEPEVTGGGGESGDSHSEGFGEDGSKWSIDTKDGEE